MAQSQLGASPASQKQQVFPQDKKVTDLTSGSGATL